MLRTVLAGTQPASADSRPDAVFVSGLPGSGKSTLAQLLHGARLQPLLPVQDCPCALIDADALRAFHGQYAALAGSPDGVRYTELNAWFMETSGFEEAIFRAPGGLLDNIMSSRVSFVQTSNMHSAGTLEWTRYVVSRGYRVHFVLVHVPVEIAVARAAARAAATGRWCSPQYVKSCVDGMLRFSAPIWRACVASGGTAVCIDNTLDCDAHRLAPAVQAGAPPISPRLAFLYGLCEELLSEARVADFARAQAARLPAGVLTGIDCCLAGGAFKALLTGSTLLAPPRDLDLWTRTAADEAALVAHLRAVPGVQYSVGRWQHAFHLATPLPAGEGGGDGDPNGRGGLLVEVKRGHRADLSATVARFDIALAAVGARLLSGDVIATVVHPLATESVVQRAPLLVPGLPNAPFLLATAERVLRYAAELGWPRPSAQLDALLAAFAAEPARRAVFIANYHTTSLFPAVRRDVLATFGIDDSEWEGVGLFVRHPLAPMWEEVSLVVGSGGWSVYLGGAGCVTPRWLRRHAIGTIVNCAADVPALSDAERVEAGVSLVASLRMVDHHAFPCKPALLEGIAAIDAAVACGRSVLVHCLRGMSRSAAVTAAWMMVRQRCTLSDALARLRAVRPVVLPNLGFLLELLRLEAELGLAGPSLRITNHPAYRPDYARPPAASPLPSDSPPEARWPLKPGALLAALHVGGDDDDAVESLLARGADANEQDTFGSPLHVAAAGGRVAAVRALLVHGAAVNDRDYRGDAPLHCAAFHGHTDVCRLLLAAGASVTARNQSGCVPQTWAASRGHAATSAWLSAAEGASVDSPGNDNEELPHDPIFGFCSTPASGCSVCYPEQTNPLRINSSPQ